MKAGLDIYANPVAATKPRSKPKLSVLIPFFRDDPAPLLNDLCACGHDEIEIIAMDDGMPEPVLTLHIAKIIQSFPVSIRLIASRPNLGRSGARNTLANHARADWLLFLDADMRIEDGFVSRWLNSIEHTDADAVFGGYEPLKPTNSKHRIHAHLARSSDVKSAKERASENPYSVCSSNTCIKANAFRHCPFDPDFVGWGWEDTSWALGLNANYKIAHIENPAGHAGLQTVDQLIAKFGQSGPNFARLLAKHPEYRARKGARLAQALKNAGLGSVAKAFGAMTARNKILPIAIRAKGLKLFRAGIAARFI